MYLSNQFQLQEDGLHFAGIEKKDKDIEYNPGQDVEQIAAE